MVLIPEEQARRAKQKAEDDARLRFRMAESSASLTPTPSPPPRLTGIEQFRQVDRAAPIPEPDTGGGGLFGVLRDIASSPIGQAVESAARSFGTVPGVALAQEAISRLPGQQRESVPNAGPMALIEQADRLGGTTRGFLSGESPADSLRRAYGGFLDPLAQDAEDIGFVRKLPEGSIARRGAGLAAEVLTDPIDFIGGGSVAVDAARLANRGIRSLSDDIAQSAIRQAEGPLEASTRAGLRPMRGSTSRAAGAAEEVLEDGSVRFRGAFHGTGDVVSLNAARAGETTGNPTAQWGVFLSPSRTEAERYVRDFHGGSGSVLASDVTLRKPYRMPFSEFDRFTNLDLSDGNLDQQMARLSREAAAFKDELISEGYDGIVIGTPGKMRPQEVVAFSDRALTNPSPFPGAVDPVIPGVTPRGRARVSGGALDVAEEVPTASPVFDAPPTVRRLYGTEPIEEGAQRGLGGRLAREGRFAADDPTATPAMLVRDESRRAVTNQATQVQERARALVNQSGFEFDKQGRIPSLANIDPDIPGAPTLRDVAARLPKYEPFLSDQQMATLDEVRAMLAPYRQALEEVAEAEARITGKPSTIQVGSRADVMEGGFYIPRGNAETEELAEIALRRGGRGPGRGKQGFEKSATFASEAEGIAAGYEYTPVADALGAYVRGIGNRTLDRHAANYFLSRVDEAGRPLGTTPIMRAMRRDPQLASQVQTLRNDIQSVRGALGRLTDRQQKVIDSFMADPAFDDLDALRDAIDGIRVGPYRGGQGPNFGMGVPDLRSRLDSLKAQIDTLRPQYRALMDDARSTPRDAGRIQLPGLEGRAFPWEVADEANRYLQHEQVANPGQVLRVVNGILRGVQATGEMSYLGIQGAVAMASGNRAWRRAAKVATRAWGSENALGDALRIFDERSAQMARPTVHEWAANGVRLAGGNTEFAVSGPQGAIRSVTRAARVPEAADRGFGAFGDTVRLELADILAEESLAAGRRLDAAEMKRIAQSVNRVTGFSQTRAAGDWGELLNFAPRYLASRIESLGQLASKDKRKRQLARRLIGRYIGTAAILTIGVNEAMGNETDFRPFSGPKGPTWNPLDAEYKNPNFFRVRALGRDWSFLGPVDATLGVVIGAGSLLSNPTGDPKEAANRLRTVLSSPLASVGLDWLVFGEDFDRNKLDNAQALGRDLLHRVVPFAVPELVETGFETADRAQSGDVAGAAGEVAGGLAQAGLGFRGTPMTVTERIREGAGYESLSPEDQFQGISAQSWKTVQENVPEELKPAVEGFTSLGQWYQQTLDDWTRAYIAQGHPAAESRREAERQIQRSDIYRYYLDVKDYFETEWYRANPELGRRHFEQQMRLPEFERRNMPTQAQLQVIAEALAAREQPAPPPAP